MKKKQKKEENKLYDFDYESKEEKKLKKKRKKAEKKSASRKGNKESSPKHGQPPKEKKYDDEIIIGVTRYPEKKQSEDKKTVKNNKKAKKVDKKTIKRRKNEENRENYNVETISVNLENKTNGENHKKIKNAKKRRKIIKIIVLIVLIIGAIVFALLSPIFNVKTIEVIGNKQISKETIKSLSGIELDENIFKVINNKIIKNIKQNAYINEVEIHKMFPNAIRIVVTEREPSYMLEYGNGYVYINNQGYMLEISSIKKELPILIGISTSKEEYKEGNRLNDEDLTKLGTVIKIMNSAQANGIDGLISKIDISDSNNYTLHLDSEDKKAYLGDCSNLETRMLFLVGILEKERGNAGEMFINMNLNTDNAFFRESV
jgi:polypeptide-transport-associated domain-containing protein